jgi:hypothetical protein
MPPEATERRTDLNSDRRRVRRGGRRSGDPRHSCDQELFERYGLQRPNDLIGDRMDRQKNWRHRSSRMLP